DGEWLLIQRADGLHVDLNVTFDLGIPSLAEVLHPIGERAIRANNIQMLDGIRNQLLARRHQRVAAGGC
ncbi:cyclase, partial [Pseudomonas amygdali pv. tabaci str. ATCC 11528]